MRNSVDHDLEDNQSDNIMSISITSDKLSIESTKEKKLYKDNHLQQIEISENLKVVSWVILKNNEKISLKNYQQHLPEKFRGIINIKLIVLRTLPLFVKIVLAQFYGSVNIFLYIKTIVEFCKKLYRIFCNPTFL